MTPKKPQLRKKPSSGRPTDRGAARQRPAGPGSGRRDRSRPSGSTRPSLRAQLDAPIEPRQRTDPQTVRRAVMLGVLLALMLVVLTPALRSYLQQREQINELKSQKVAAQQSVGGLENSKKQWQDPNYVKKQASQRLGFGMPGQQITVYVDDSGRSHDVPAQNGVVNASALREHPWYGQLWGSVSTSSNAQNKIGSPAK